MAYDFKKAFAYLDGMLYMQLRFSHFVEANRLAGNPFTASKLQEMWDGCAEAGPDQAPLLKEVFRSLAGGSPETGRSSPPPPAPRKKPWWKFW